MLNKEDKFVAFSRVEKQKDDEMKEDFTLCPRVELLPNCCI
jgi:hypothetical protein